MSEEIYKSSISDLHKLISTKKISCAEVVRSYLDRIDSLAKRINAFLFIQEEEAIKSADAIDKKIKDGEKPEYLEGIPIAIKSNINTKDVETNCASKILAGFKPPFDATAVERLKNAGMIPLGKTNMDEFAMGSSNEHSAFGAVSNPWDTDRAPGGSSGGSAAAVSAGMSPAALGSDTAGSVRQPAAFCGITGIKPTYGRVSRYGLVAFGSSFDQIGPMTRTAEDMAHIMSVMSGHDPHDSTSSEQPVDDYRKTLEDSVKGRCIGIPKEYFTEGLSEEVRNAVEAAVDFYKKNGCEVVEISLPHTDYGIACYYILAQAEASSNLARYDGIRYGYREEGELPLKRLYSVTRDKGFGEEVKRRIMLGTYVLSAGYYEAYYKKAQKVRTLIRKDFEDAFEKVDFVIAPTTPSTAFKIGEKLEDPLQMYLSDVYTANVNMSGIPAVSIPVGFDKNSLPIGMQIMGRWFDEGGILNLAHIFQKNTDHHKKFPDL